MRYLVLATDYDGTIARDGVVDAPTIQALERFRADGGRPILVTGRELPDLERTFARFDVFERIVAENGGVLYDPATGSERVLCAPSNAALVDALSARDVPLSVGRAIIATVEPYQQAALDAIRALGLELQVIFNKGAVMVLPSGVNKATGLLAALEALQLSPRDVVGIGDGENDHAFLEICELSVAVGNAVPALRERADLLTRGARGDGVQELIDRLLSSDPDPDPDLSPRRRWLSIGSAPDRAVAIDPHGRSLLISGSDSGRATLMTTLFQQLTHQGYQFCLVDSEGRYGAFPHAIRIGMSAAPPQVDEVLDAIQPPDQSVVVTLTGVPAADRPEYFASLLRRLQMLRRQTGRPHWIAVDEAEHAFPADGRTALTRVSLGHGLLMATLNPDRISPVALDEAGAFIALGEVTAAFTSMLGPRGFQAPPRLIHRGMAVMWRPGDPVDGLMFTIREPAHDHGLARRPD